MKKYKETTIEVIDTKIDKIVCNVCGNEIKVNELGYSDDYLSIEKRWGYGSGFDNEVHSIDICQHCYEKLFDSLKVDPRINQ